MPLDLPKLKISEDEAVEEMQRELADLSREIGLLKDEQIKKMEDAFPDFIALMASNLRAGMTVDRALLLSSRKEFAPLDIEILNLGKEIITGKEIDRALLDLGRRIKSEEIQKTIFLINSGIKSGGNLSILLEQIASNMRERVYVRKRAASNVTMYFIFIFFAVAIGAPVLFGFSSVLVEILSKLLENIPVESVKNVNIPFALTKINISSNFVFYFVLLFLTVSDILASLALGLVSKGEEKEGLRYTPILIATSITAFLASRFLILYYFANLFG